MDFCPEWEIKHPAKRQVCRPYSAPQAKIRRAFRLSNRIRFSGKSGADFFGRQSPSAQAQNVKKRCKATVSGCFTPRRQPSVGCRPMDRRRFVAGHRFPAITGTGRKGDPPSGRIKGKSSGVFFSAPPDTQPRKLSASRVNGFPLRKHSHVISPPSGGKLTVP